MKTDQPICGIVIDVCPCSTELGVNLKDLEASLSALGADIILTDSLCESPSRMKEMVEEYSWSGAVVVCRGDKKHISWLYAERALTHPYPVEFVDIRLLGVSNSDYDAFKLTLLIHMAKALNAHPLPNLKAKPLRFDNEVSRRDFFRAATASLTEYPDIPVYQSELCTVHIGSCTHCIDACPYGAVDKDGTGISIDQERCLKCGVCCTACPTGALQLPTISDTQTAALLEAASSEQIGLKDRMIAFTCNQGIEEIVNRRGGEDLNQGIAVVQVPCIAALGFLHYILASSTGVNLTAICPNRYCRLNSALPVSREAAALVRSLTEASGSTPNVAFIEAAEINAVTRLLNSAFKSMPSTYREKYELGGGSRRDLLVRALSKTASDSECKFGGAASPFCDLSIDPDACTLCGACVKVCPEGSLELVEDASSVELVFMPRRCVVCYACEKICPERILHVERSFSPRDIVEDAKYVKARGEAATCVKCGSYIAPAKKLQRVEAILSRNGVGSAPDYLHLCSRCRFPI